MPRSSTLNPTLRQNAGSGQPVEDLPPLVGFGEFEEPTAPPPPPRRGFVPSLAPTPKAAPPAAPIPTAHPPPIESAAVPAPPAPEPTAASIAIERPPPVRPTAAPVAPIPAREPAMVRVHAWKTPTEWLSAARAALPAGWSRPALAAGVASVLIVGAVVAADLAGIGPFSSLRQFRASTPPSDPALLPAYYAKGARAGDAEAELQLAILYAKGKGVPQDYATSATWFRAAAEQGVARAQYDLGVLYERGRGVPVDLIEAANWYQKAAQANYPLAQYNLAVCYTKGQGIRQDLAEAALWYRRAAVQGVVQAMTNLGTMYERGDGVAASPVDAYAWFLAAGRRDNSTAARHADELFASLPELDQVRAQALASDVAASIHDPQPERAEAAGRTPEVKPAAPDH